MSKRDIAFVPTASRSAQHVKEILKFGGEFVVTGVQERTSKQGRLKMNYGGITTARTRNHEALRRLHEADDEDRYRNKA